MSEPTEGISENPPVTVVIPTYNYARFLPQAVESVLGQSFADFELIIVDDGSTDNTGEAARPFLKDPRVRYVYQDNRGLPGARNRGILEARGEFVAFLDSDDYWLPSKLEKQVPLMEADGEVVLVYCGAEFIDAEGNVKPDPFYKPIPGATYKDLLYVNWVMGSGSSVLIRKAVFDEAGLFDENLTALDDIDMWIRILRRRKSDFVDEALVRIRRHRSMGFSNTIDIRKRERAYFSHIRKYMELFPELRLEKRNACFQTYRKLFYESYEYGRTRETLEYYLKACSHRPLFIYESISSHLKKRFMRIPGRGRRIDDA